MKKSKFTNPFDLKQEQNVQLNYSNQSKSYESDDLSNPLPFNPYQISTQSNLNQKKSQKNIIYPSIPPEGKHEISNSQTSQKLPTQQQFIKPEKLYQLNEDGDPPLLQDIGIEPQKIKQRIILVLKMGNPTFDLMEDPDLSGPILIALAFGFLLLFSGKVHFGDIYAIFIFGNILIYCLYNCMSKVSVIPFYNIMSTMGYGMLPMLLLGLIGILFTLKGPIGIIFGLALSVWSSIAAGNIMKALMRQQQSSRKILIIYPLFLFYVSFAMIVMF